MLSIRIARLRSHSRSYYANVALARVCSRINNVRSIPMSAVFYAGTACTAVLVSAIIGFNPIKYDFSKSLRRKICKTFRTQNVQILKKKKKKENNFPIYQFIYVNNILSKYFSLYDIVD